MLPLLWVACSSPQSALDCAPIPGAEELVTSRRVLFVGEIHGTEEIPRFTGELVCHALRKDKPVLLALELPSADNGLLQTFLEDGNPDPLLQSPFWTRADQDGRTSRAMMELLLRAHAMHEAGKPVDVVGFDVERKLGTMPAERDRGMAEQLIGAMKAHPDALVVALAGNVHGRRSLGVPWDPIYQPMAAYLPEERLVSLLAMARHGSAFNCQSDGCMSRTFGDPATPPVAPAVSLYPELQEGYDAEVEFGRFTASLPARLQ
jgi:hypothetical protein